MGSSSVVKAGRKVGHLIGDHVLREVATRLTALARDQDTIARVGGEEFAWLMPERDGHAAWTAAEQARRTVRDVTFQEAGRLTMSAGVAELAAGASVNDLFRAADAALYWGKGQGRDVCVSYAPEHGRAITGRSASATTRLVPSVGRLLGLAREQLGLALVAVGQFRQDTQVWRYLDGDGEAFGMRVGGEVSLSDACCQRVIDGRLPGLIRDVRREVRARELPGTREAGIGAYLAAPVVLPDGELYGMLCALSPRAEPSLGQRDLRLLRILAGMIGEEIGREAREGADWRGTHERVRRVVDGHELTVVLQPIVELAGGHVVGVEALSRFPDDPARPPAVWFAEAAAVGLGVDLELAAIRAVLVQLGQIPPSARLLLNVSPAAICSRKLDALLIDVPAARLALEVTEHAPGTDYARLEEALAELRQRGAQLMIDDVGAGCSSLKRIVRLRPDAIKLDISLTGDIDSDPVRRAVAASLVAFAREIGATIVAEGIETQGELETLRALGVTHGQGYFLQAPRPGPVPPKLALRDVPTLAGGI